MTVDEKEDISLDLSDISVEDLEPGKGPVMEDTEEEEQAIDLDGLLLEESEDLAETAPENIPLDTAEMVTSEIDIKKLKVSEDMEDLDLELDIEELDDK